MKRPIKFRAKGSGLWRYGQYVHTSKNPPHPYNRDYTDYIVSFDDFGYHHIPITDIDTLGQFTGLHDEHFTEIYEGDILCADFMYGRVVNGGYAPDECLCWGVVEFDDINLCWSLNVYKAEPYISEVIKENGCSLIDLHLFNEDSGYEYASPLMEVIGNIHDNNIDELIEKIE